MQAGGGAASACETIAHHPYDTEASRDSFRRSLAHATEEYNQWSRGLLRVRPWDLEANLAVSHKTCWIRKTERSGGAADMALQDADFAHDKRRVLSRLSEINNLEAQRCWKSRGPRTPSQMTFRAVEYLRWMLPPWAKAHRARLAQADPRMVTRGGPEHQLFNVCAATCSSAFSRKPGDAEGYVLPLDELFQKIEELVNTGGTQVLLQGGLHPKLPLEFYCDLLSQVKRRFPVDLHAFSAPEIFFFSKKFKRSIAAVLQALREAGLDTIPGGRKSRPRAKAITQGKCLT